MAANKRSTKDKYLDARIATIKRPCATRDEIGMLAAFRRIPSKIERRALVVLAEGIAFGRLIKKAA